MPYQDFRQFLDALRREGELIDIDRPIALNDVGKALKQSYVRQGPAMMFNQNGTDVRLVAGVCEERYGWRPRAVGRILVLPERERHRIERHALTFRAAYPRGTRELRQWLRQPDGPASGIWFMTSSHPGTGIRNRPGSQRLRLPSSVQAEHGLASTADRRAPFPMHNPDTSPARTERRET